MEVARKRHELEMQRMQLAREEELREEAKRRKEYETEFKKQYQSELEKENQSSHLTTPQQDEKEMAGRRPSRFEVTSVDPSGTELSNDPELLSPDALSEKRPSIFDSLGIDLSAKPKKSILKKNNASTIHAIDTQRRPGISALFNTLPINSKDSGGSPYMARNTVTGADTKLKSAFGNIQSIFKRPSNLTLDARSNMTLDGKGNEQFDPFSMFAKNNGAMQSPGGTLKSGHRVAYKMDMGIDEQQEWEEQEMEREVDFKKFI